MLQKWENMQDGTFVLSISVYNSGVGVLIFKFSLVQAFLKSNFPPDFYFPSCSQSAKVTPRILLKELTLAKLSFYLSNLRGIYIFYLNLSSDWGGGGVDCVHLI